MDSLTNERHGLVIVGAGPIGIELAVACRRAEIPALQVEAGCLGATIAWWAPGTRFFSSPERIEIAGLPLETPIQDKATREDYLTYLRQVVGREGLRIETGTRVVEASPAPKSSPDGGYRLVLETRGVRRTVLADRVALATGNMDRPRRLGVPGEDAPWVSHYLREPHVYAGRRVLIVGGKNSAAEAAVRLHRIGAEVTMSYRGAEFDAERIKYWLLPELKWLIEKSKIGFLPETCVTRIAPEGVHLAPAGGGGGARVVDADDVLLMTGYVQDRTLYDQLGVGARGEEQRPVYDADTMETDAPGVYVLGTACGGSQRRARVFIENSHVHVERVVAHITGRAVEKADVTYGAMEES
ncbi:MAG: thioredoxin reductase [Phycisphaerales bacterium]|nr:MAG: thioredoxin reductase [Phycisphaerales bacterium]